MQKDSKSNNPSCFKNYAWKIAIPISVLAFLGLGAYENYKTIERMIRSHTCYERIEEIKKYAKETGAYSNPEVREYMREAEKSCRETALTEFYLNKAIEELHRYIERLENSLKSSEQTIEINKLLDLIYDLFKENSLERENKK